MKKLILLSAIAVSFTFNTIAQNVGVGTTSPAAKLDISSTNSGILIPRVALTSTTVAAPVTSPATSTLVYNTLLQARVLLPLLPVIIIGAVPHGHACKTMQQQAPISIIQTAA